MSSVLVIPAPKADGQRSWQVDRGRGSLPVYQQPPCGARQLYEAHSLRVGNFEGAINAPMSGSVETNSALLRVTQSDRLPDNFQAPIDTECVKFG